MIGNCFIIGISIILFWNISVAQSIYQNEDNISLLNFLKTLNMENCVEDVPAPELMIEPRFTQGSTNKICFRLPEISLIPFSLDSVKNPFVMTLVRNTKNNVLFEYPRPVDLNNDSLQLEIINAIAHDTEYIYSIKLFLPECTVGCDNVLDGSELDLHCSAYEDTVFSTQDSEPPIVQNILIPGLIFLSDNNWLNKSNFMINADLVDPAGIWQAFLYRRECTENGWHEPAIDTTFTGELTNTGYVFNDRMSVTFNQYLPDGCYEFRIEGKDASHTPESCFPNFKIAGNGGAPGEGAVSHIKINIDTTPPEAVEINYRQIKNTMALFWKPSLDFHSGIGLDGYRILRDGQLLDNLEANVLSYVDTI